MCFYKIFILYCQYFMDIFGIEGVQKLEYHFWKHFIPLFHTYAGTAVKNYYECALHTVQGFSFIFHPVMYNSGDFNLTIRYWTPTFSKATSIFQIWCANWFMQVILASYYLRIDQLIFKNSQNFSFNCNIPGLDSVVLRIFKISTYLKNCCGTFKGVDFSFWILEYIDF